MKPLLRSNLVVLLIILVFNSKFIYSKENPSNANPVEEEIEEEFDQSNEDKSDEVQLTDEDFVYITPDVEPKNYYLFEHFDDEKQYLERWFKSLASKADSKDFKYDGEWSYINSHSKLKGDNAIMMNSKAKHHAIATKLLRKFEFKRDPLVLQYEVKFSNGQECGGAYIKLLSSPVKDLHKINDVTPYTIMFGPDKCGNDHKLHFIFKHKNPKNGTIREIHLKKSNVANKLSEIFKDQRWHAFRLTIRPDNTYEIQLDKKVIAKGSLLEDFEPPVNPPKDINDPNDKRPEDFDEREKIPDPEDRKPDDWNESEPRKIVDPNAKIPSDWLENEPELIPDENAKMPSNWDNEIDGIWEAPLINNPKCAKVSGCGKWRRPLIDNPKFKGKWKPRLIPNSNYKGPWQPRKIKNPDYYNDEFPFKMSSIDAVCFELWTVSDGIAFDNILITDNVDVANYILDHTFQLKKEISDAETDNWFVKMIKETNKKPYLWIVYLLVIAALVLLFIGYCCVTPGRKVNKNESSSKSDEDQNSNDDLKNDDQPTSSARLRKTVKRAD